MSHQRHEDFLGNGLPPRGRVAIDVGANDGQYVERLVGRFEVVIAFEPQARMFERLFATWGGDRRVKLHRAACGDVAGLGDLQVSPELRFAQAATLRAGGHPHGYPLTQVEQVPVVRLDQAAVDVGPIDWLKIDTEGYDLEALRGAEGLIRRDAPGIQFEEHVDGDLDQAMELLESFAPGRYTFEICKQVIPWRNGAVQRWLLAYRRVGS